jgi:UDP-N-acetylmuramoyl-L-alanyl-D-glutamate--2,6-diaminopimelate ligase
MHLHDLCRDLPVRLPPENPDVVGMSHDSRRVAPGDLYVAIVGERFDGREYSSRAVASGAVAVLGPGARPEGLTVPWVEVDDPRPLLGALASRVYGRPHERLKVVGVTGTNGKSTVIHLVASLLSAAGAPAGLIGTIGYHFGERSYLEGAAGGLRTTPEAPDLFRLLNQMKDDGAAAVTMEVSSHALAIGRVSSLELDLALFTNLSRDHLDFHHDMESYFDAKRQVFKLLKSGGSAIVALVDDYGRRLAGELRAAGEKRLLTCGEDEGDVQVLESRLTLDGIEARLATPRGELAFTTPLLGRYNLWNILVAVAAAEALELPHDVIAETLASQPTIPGRLEKIDGGQEFPVLVDYAHTPGALVASLRSLRELTDRRLAVVFGCGGDRDQGKRSEMGRIVGELAELPIATSDNPRREDPEAILDAVAEGLDASRHLSGSKTRFERIVDRREAIRRAIQVAAAEPGCWTVVVAGKGHEEGQILADTVVPFSDHEEIKAALEELHG